MTETSRVVRPFAAKDYAAMCQVSNAAFPEYPESQEAVRQSDESRAPHLRCARWVAEVGTVLVGWGWYFQSSHLYHPHKFGIDMTVLPEYQGRGIGRALYQAILAGVTEHAPIQLRTHAREDQQRAIRFLCDRGFQAGQREQESYLDLSAWQPDKWSDEQNRLAANGSRIASYPELLAAYGDAPTLHQKLEALHWAVVQDVPQSEPVTRPSLAEFAKRFVRLDFVPEANLFALEGDDLIGETALWGTPEDSDLSTSTTGVLRAYRGKGIATALKVAALSVAKARGASGVRTWNEVNNTAMLGINRRLGFVARPAWIEYQKFFTEEHKINV